MSAIAIITARGNSKRIFKKNIKFFCGKPIIAYSIEAALESNIFDEVMVSTDSEEIAEVALKYGAKVPFFRSPQNSDDYATTADVLYEVIEQYEKSEKFFDMMCCLYPTAPFVTAQKLNDSFMYINEHNAASLMPVVRYSYPPQRGMSIKEGKLYYTNPQYVRSRSQDLEPIYHDAGQFYFCRINEFKVQRSLVTDNTLPYVIPETEVQDIDNLSDWKLAEIKFKMFITKESNQ